MYREKPNVHLYLVVLLMGACCGLKKIIAWTVSVHISFLDLSTEKIFMATFAESGPHNRYEVSCYLNTHYGMNVLLVISTKTADEID